MMTSGTAQDVAVEHFLRDIESRGRQLHFAVIGQQGESPHGDMNLLYRKSRLDWRQRESEGNRKSSSSKDPSGTVGKVRDLGSFRRHFRMGFMTMPASQDLSPCTTAMAPRSQSCHSVGRGDYHEGPLASPSGYHPPTKPKRNPSTRLSFTPEPRNTGPPKSALPQLEKRSAMNKSNSGEMLGRRAPPLKPKRSPNTQLTFDIPPPRVAPPPTPLSCHAQEEGMDEESVYIEMVGQVFPQESLNAAAATTPDSDLDQSEAIYEEMKYPLPDDAQLLGRAHPRHDRPKSSKPSLSNPVQSSSQSVTHPAAFFSSPCPKAKAAVSISHSSPLPSSSPASTPVPRLLSSSPQPPRAATPYVLPGNRSHADSSNKIPAPFPNLLQHRPPLLAFPQPAAASSGVGAQLKLGAISTPASQGTATPPPASAVSKVPVSQPGPEEPSAGSGAQQERQTDRREAQIGPAPGLRARSHSSPLPPSEQSSSSSYYSHHHHHTHHPPSNYHHYRRPEKQGSQASAQTQASSGRKEGKSASLLSKLEKREREREMRETPVMHSAIPSQTVASPSPAPAPSSHSSTHRSSSRPLLQHTHGSAHPIHQALPAYKPPASDSPLLWTYPSAGMKRPPAYDSVRAVPQITPPTRVADSGPKGGLPPLAQSWKIAISRDGGNAEGTIEEGASWPLHRKLSFSQRGRDTDKGESQVWNGSVDALPRVDRTGHTSIRTGGVGGGHCSEMALGRSGIPLPCQTFPACHRNGELGRLGRSSSTSGVRHGISNVHRQGRLPPRETQNQDPSQTLPPSTPTPSLKLQQLQIKQQQQLQHQLQLQLQYQHLAQLAQCQSPVTGGAAAPQPQTQRDGKLLEVIERKRYLCKEIKAHRRPDRSLCKQDSMPILPSWRRTPEPRKTGTPPCPQQAVLWDTAI